MDSLFDLPFEKPPSEDRAPETSAPPEHSSAPIAPVPRRVLSVSELTGRIRTLFEHYCEHPTELPPAVAGEPLSTRVTDYLAGMTDRFCLRAYEALAVPQGFM